MNVCEKMRFVGVKSCAPLCLWAVRAVGGSVGAPRADLQLSNLDFGVWL